MKLELQAVLPRKSVHWIPGKHIWGSQGQWVLASSGHKSEWEYLGSLDKTWKQRLLPQFQLLSRFLRLGINNMLMLKSGIVLVIADGTIYRSVDRGKRFTPVHALRHGHYPSQEGFNSDRDGNVYCGEYWSNSERQEVSILKSIDAGKTWGTVHSFPPGAVRHIHAVQYDRFSGAIWVTTGDSDSESRIAYSRNGGRSFTEIGAGSQKWRAVSLIFAEEYVYWGTDNPEGHNYIYRWRRSDGSLEKVAPVKGPVYYSKKVGDYLLFSTAVERGEGDQDGYARIYGIDKGLNCHELYKLAKDRWHPVLFGYGVLEFARGELDEESFWVTAKGLAGGQRSILFRLKT